MTAVLVIVVCVAAVAGAVGGFFVKLTKSSCWGVTVLLALIFEGIIGAAVKKTSSGYGLALLISTVVVAVVFMCVFGVLKKLLYKAAEARRQLSHYKNYDDKEENEELILAAVDSGDKRQYKKQLKKGKRIKDSAGVWGFIDRITGAVNGCINAALGTLAVILCVLLFVDLSGIGFLSDFFAKPLASGSWTNVGKKLALDLPLTCVLAFSIKAGYKSGISTVLCTVIIIALVAGFGYSAWAIASGPACENAVEGLRNGMLKGLTNSLGDVTVTIARALIALLIFLLSLVVIIIAAIFLPKLFDRFRENKVFGAVDGVLGAIVLCAFVTALLTAVGGITYTLHDLEFMAKFGEYASASKLGDAMYSCNPMASAFASFPLRGWFNPAAPQVPAE